MSALSLAPGETINITAYANFPAGIPPAGVKPNFVDPYQDNKLLIVLGSILMASMLLCASCRAYYKIRLLHGLSWDDLCLFIGILGTIISFIGSIMTCTWGKGGVDIWNLKVGQIATGGMAMSSAMIEIGGSWTPVFIKSAFFLLFWTIFNPSPWIRWTIAIGGTISTLINIGCATVITYYAVPPPHQSIIDYAASGRALYGFRLAIPVSAVAVVTDVFLVIVPMIAVFGLQMATRKKVAITGVFLAAALAIIASALSLYYRVIIFTTSNYTGVLPPMFLCCIAEYTIGICCACAPAISHLIRVKSPFSCLRAQISSFRRRNGLYDTSWGSDKSTMAATPHIGPRGRRFRGFRGLGTVFPRSFARTFHVTIDGDKPAKSVGYDSTSTYIYTPSTGTGTMLSTNFTETQKTTIIDPSDTFDGTPRTVPTSGVQAASMFSPANSSRSGTWASSGTNLGREGQLHLGHQIVFEQGDEAV